jgi:hypothetical protein
MGYRVEVGLGAITVTPSGDRVGAAGRTEVELLATVLEQERRKRAPVSVAGRSPDRRGTPRSTSGPASRRASIRSGNDLERPARLPISSSVIRFTVLSRPTFAGPRRPDDGLATAGSPPGSAPSRCLREHCTNWRAVSRDFPGTGPPTAFVLLACAPRNPPRFIFGGSARPTVAQNTSEVAVEGRLRLPRADPRHPHARSRPPSPALDDVRSPSFAAIPSVGVEPSDNGSRGAPASRHNGSGSQGSPPPSAHVTLWPKRAPLLVASPTSPGHPHRGHQTTSLVGHREVDLRRRRGSGVGPVHAPFGPR